mmetsp:Transcript_43070/g.80191  ORF Transcript_43070/g.80191 Transcript_43070/m.80191 type:complete len:345 (-) Transcript_43070:108-1142(-)
MVPISLRASCAESEAAASKPNYEPDCGGRASSLWYPNLKKGETLMYTSCGVFYLSAKPASKFSTARRSRSTVCSYESWSGNQSSWPHVCPSGKRSRGQELMRLTPRPSGCTITCSFGRGWIACTPVSGTRLVPVQNSRRRDRKAPFPARTAWKNHFAASRTRGWSRSFTGTRPAGTMSRSSSCSSASRSVASPSSRRCTPPSGTPASLFAGMTSRKPSAKACKPRRACCFSCVVQQSRTYFALFDDFTAISAPFGTSSLPQHVKSSHCNSSSLISCRTRQRLLAKLGSRLARSSSIRSSPSGVSGHSGVEFHKLQYCRQEVKRCSTLKTHGHKRQSTRTCWYSR